MTTPHDQPVLSTTASASILFRLNAALCVIVVLFCVTLIVVSRAFPSTDELSSVSLTNCGGNPCLNGIAPGRTSWADALAAFNGQARIRGNAAHGDIVLLPSTDGRTLDSILFERPNVALGTIIARYGSPACTDINPAFGTMILHYPYLHALARFNNNRVNPNTPVLTMVLWDAQGSSEQTSHLCKLAPDNEQISEHAWLGFASMQRYLGLG